MWSMCDATFGPSCHPSPPVTWVQKFPTICPNTLGCLKSLQFTQVICWFWFVEVSESHGFLGPLVWCLKTGCIPTENACRHIAADQQGCWPRTQTNLSSTSFQLRSSIGYTCQIWLKTLHGNAREMKKYRSIDIIYKNMTSACVCVSACVAACKNLCNWFANTCVYLT